MVNPAINWHTCRNFRGQKRKKQRRWVQVQPERAGFNDGFWNLENPTNYQQTVATSHAHLSSSTQHYNWVLNPMMKYWESPFAWLPRLNFEVNRSHEEKRKQKNKKKNRRYVKTFFSKFFFSFQFELLLCDLLIILKIPFPVSRC